MVRRRLGAESGSFALLLFEGQDRWLGLCHRVSLRVGGPVFGHWEWRGCECSWFSSGVERLLSGLSKGR